MITKRDKYFIELAFAQAISIEKAGGARIGAAFVLKNKVIAFGTNKRKTHPFQAKYGCNKEAIFLHSEIDCIKNALKRINIDDMRKSVLYIARAKKDGYRNSFRYGMAKPCIGCMRAIGAFEIKKVVYTTDNGTIDIFTRK